jgi:hypothetical protein
VFYRKMGRLVVVHFALAGTSNATTVSFTLPYAKDSVSSSPAAQTPCKARDNGTYYVGLAVIFPGGSTVSVYPTVDTTVAWTNSGAKEAFGTLIYFTD